MRLKVGEPLRVFNGRGREFEATIETASASSVHVRLGPRLEAAPEPRVAMTLAQAILKGAKMDDVVRDSTMMGVAAIQPIVTERAEVTRSSLTSGQRRERWQRIAVSSAKQCGRATVPEIYEPLEFDQVIDALSKMTLPLPGLMLVEPGAAMKTTSVSELDLSPQRSATLLIGPEGGWTLTEVERAATACRLITVGGRTLRADVMCVVALSALFTMWREF